MAKIFTLMRHGQVAGDAALYGHTDIELSAEGRLNFLQAIARVHQQSAIESIISSPLIRCAHTAREFSLQHNLPLQWEPQFKEMHFGDWDGIPFDRLQGEWSNLEAFWSNPSHLQPPNGEHLDLFAARVIAAWEKYCASMLDQHYLVLLHGGAIRIIIAHILQLNWRSPVLYQQLQINYASNTRIEISQNGLAVIKWINLH